MIGQTVEHYRVLSRLGAGGMAVVYEAIDERLQRRVALKVLPEEYRDNSVALDRFLREAQTASSLNHPGICSIFDIGNSQGRPFIVMELLAGQSLRDRIRNAAPLPLSEVLRFGQQILDALGAAHEKGIVHRDIKPENIFVNEQGRIKLLDFGLARPLRQEMAAAAPTQLTTPGLIVGTILYMSPEQLRAEAVDARTDIYSVALTLYEMATGVLPSRQPTTAQTMASILYEDPSPPSNWVPTIPTEFDRVILQALNKDRSSRPVRVDEFSRRLSLIEGEQSAIPSPVPLQTQTSLTSSGADAQSISSSARVSLTGSWIETPLVGRRRETEAIRADLANSLHGRGNLLLVDGEPGIGKTTLLRSVMELAVRRGMLVLLGRCSELEPSAPYLPFVEMLEHLVRARPLEYLQQKIGDIAPELARLSPQIRKLLAEGRTPLNVPPEQERYLLFSSLAETVERLSGDSPLLLVIEDLHWADQPTAHLLEHLAIRIPFLPVLAIGSFRSDTASRRGSISICRELIRQSRAKRIRLAPLTLEEVGELLSSKVGQRPPHRVCDAIYRFTEGNPFFVEESFHLLKEEDRLVQDDGSWRSSLDLSDLVVPEGVRVLISRRLDRLGREALPLLQLAALFGREFQFDHLQEVACDRWDTDAVIEVLEAAEQHGLIAALESGDDIAYSFSHALVQQTLVETLSLPRKRQWHLKIADAVEQRGVSEGSPLVRELAHHLNSAGSLVRADRRLQWTIQAAGQALGQTAFEESIRLYSEALKLSDPAGDQRAGLLFKRGLAHTGLRDWKAAQDDWREALPLFERAGAAHQVAQICSILAAQSIWTGDLFGARSISQRGLEALGSEPGPDRCRLLAWAGHSYNQKGEMKEGGRLTAEALAMVRELPDPVAIGNVLTHRACQAFYSMRFQEQARIGAEAAELLAEDPWACAEALTIAQLGYLHSGDLPKARELRGKLVKLAERIGHLGSLWMAGRAEGLSGLMETGNLEAFRCFAQRDLEACRHAGIRWVSEAHVWLGQVEFWRGNWESSEAHFREGVSLEPDDFTAGLDRGAFLTCLAYLGRPEEPVKAYERYIGSGSPSATTGQCSFAIAAVEGAATLGRRDLAGALYPTLRQILGHGNTIRFNAAGLIESMAGVAAAADRHWEISEVHFRRALRQAEEIPYRIEQAEVRRWYVWMLTERAKTDDLSRARTLAEEATRLYGELGMPRHSQITSELISSRSPSA